MEHILFEEAGGSRVDSMLKTFISSNQKIKVGEIKCPSIEEKFLPVHMPKS
jgi:hypothetical protein